MIQVNCQALLSQKHSVNPDQITPTRETMKIRRSAVCDCDIS